MRWRHWRYTIPLRLRSLFRRSDVESELSEELEYHLAKQTEQNLAAGMNGAEARRRAVLSLDGIERQKEEVRDSLGWRALETLWRDTTQALRRLANDWQFSAGAVLILALGISVNTAVFSIVNNVLFQPNPYADSHRLVNLYQNDSTTGEPEGVSYPAFEDLQKEGNVFSGVLAYMEGEGRYQAESADGTVTSTRNGITEYVSANLMDVLGMHPSLGRWFTAEEAKSRAPVVVLGRKAWERDFNADPRVLGRIIHVSGEPLQIIGIGPLELNSLQSNSIITDLWLPVDRMDRKVAGSETGTLLSRRDLLFLDVKARLRDGVSVEQAQAAMDVVARRLESDHPEEDPGRGMTVLATDSVSVHPKVERILKPVALALLTLVGLVLAIACSNLATLLLVRGSARSSEMSVRRALGATRWQLMRYLLTESVVLASMGTALGVVIALLGLRYLASFNLPLVIDMTLDYHVLGFAIAIAAVCGIGLGLAPALQSTRDNLMTALREQKEHKGGAVSWRGWFSMKNALLVGQVMASFILLIGAALAVGMATESRNRTIGFPLEGLAMVEADPVYADYDLQRTRGVYADLRDRVAAIPGVESAMVANILPMNGRFDRKIRREGAGGVEEIEAEGSWEFPGYFETMGIPLLYGRGFEASDSAGKRDVAVLSEQLAREIFGTLNVVGNSIRFAGAAGTPVEIIGVAGNTRNVDEFSTVPEPVFYLAAGQGEVMPRVIVARTSGDAIALVGQIQNEIRSSYPDLPVISGMTMQQFQERAMRPVEITILSMAGLGVLGMVLAGIGLYAVVSYAGEKRSSEIGIRIALGALPASLTWLVVREVTVLVGIGIGIGALVSFAGVTAIQSASVTVMGVSSLAVVAVAVVIAGCGAAAAYIPARRAAHTDPLVAIRHE